MFFNLYIHNYYFPLKKLTISVIYMLYIIFLSLVLLW